jgi:hypothetical protein
MVFKVDSGAVFRRAGNPKNGETKMSPTVGMKESVVNTVGRDDSGRAVAADGWPVGGNARVREVAAYSGLSKGEIYARINSGELESRRFGKAICVPWKVVRRTFS